MKLRSKAEKNSAEVALIAGIQKYLPTATFYVEGQSVPASQVVATLQGRVDAAHAVVTAEATWHGTVRTSDALHASTDAYPAAVRQTVLAMFASQPATLTEFAVSARKQPAPRTAAQQVVRAAKVRATREARGTMGARQKAAIKGTVTGTIVVKVDGSSSSIASSPAPTAPPAAPAARNGSSSTPHS